MDFYRDYDAQRAQDAAFERVVSTPPHSITPLLTDDCAPVEALLLSGSEAGRMYSVPEHPLPRGMPPARAST